MHSRDSIAQVLLALKAVSLNLTVLPHLPHLPSTGPAADIASLAQFASTPLRLRRSDSLDLFETVGGRMIDVPVGLVYVLAKHHAPKGCGSSILSGMHLCRLAGHRDESDLSLAIRRVVRDRGRKVSWRDYGLRLGG